MKKYSIVEYNIGDICIKKVLFNIFFIDCKNMYKNINLYGKLLKIIEIFFKKEFIFFNINILLIIIMIFVIFVKFKFLFKNIIDKSSKNNEFKLFIGVISEIFLVVKDVIYVIELIE